MKWTEEQINQKWIEFQEQNKKRPQKAEQPQNAISEMIRAIYTGETAGMFT